ncbi:uncharacterized protein LOC108023839 [Drosophila biarmipes]|uniref:uncharacterized protein LOC108023839 n=1 Tax=Drosophila biarmipes TaxID=125945 RepID=UPI0007E7AD7C|nr:uncharacterized protein LOC108023839 [Drosophila biarmipes]XP_050745787.1 uncharacterized protein LOC108023839 [Drosophila biarmipes]
MAMDTQKTYAVLGNCLSIGITTVCQEKNLGKLDEASCIPRLLKGGQALCDHLRNDQEIVELVFNFNGTLIADSGSSDDLRLRLVTIHRMEKNNLHQGHSNASRHRRTGGAHHQ